MSNKKSNILSTFTSGTGVSENDITPVGIDLYHKAGVAGEIDSSMFIGSGIIMSGTTETYEEMVNFSVSPGYIYFGDREYYLFNNKYTQVSIAVPSGNVYVVPLKEIPDGIKPIYVDDLYYLGKEEKIIYGASPIILHTHQANTLQQIGVPYDTIISSKYGISGQMGYRINYESNPSGEIISGEVSNYPWYFSPIERFAKTYEYWRDDNSLISIDNYYYDFNSNSIIINEDVSNQEIAIEFEGTNEPLITGLDLSPLVTYPETSIISLSSSENFEEEIPGSINLHITKKRLRNETITIIAEVLSSAGNRLPNTNVDFYIERPDLEIAGEVPVPLIGHRVIYNNDFCIDRIEAPEAEIREAGLLVSNTRRINGEAYLPGVGFLTDIDYVDDNENIVGYSFSKKTDDMGFSHILYHVPSGIVSTTDISIKAIAGSVSKSEKVVLLSDNTINHYVTSDYNRDIWSLNSGTINDNTLTIPLLSGCISPSSIEVMPADVFCSLMGTDNNIDMMYPTNFNITNNVPYVDFTTYISGVPFVVKYPMGISNMKLDGRIKYERIY